MTIYGPFEPDLVHTSGGKWRHLAFGNVNARPLPIVFRERPFCARQFSGDNYSFLFQGRV